MLIPLIAVVGVGLVAAVVLLRNKRNSPSEEKQLTEEERVWLQFDQTFAEASELFVEADKMFSEFGHLARSFRRIGRSLSKTGYDPVSRHWAEAYSEKTRVEIPVRKVRR